MSELNGSAPRLPRKRWPMALAGILGLLLLVSLGAAVLSLRRLEGAVPGSAPVLGLVATADGYLVGTSGGVYSSLDGVQWSPVDRFPEGALVAQSDSGLYVLSDAELYFGMDPGSFDRIAGDLPQASAMAVDADGRVWLGLDGGILVIEPDGRSRRIAFDGGPRSIVALAVDGETGELWAGGLSSGLWRSGDEGQNWEQLLETPVRAAVLSPDGRERFIGTAGGVLYSTPERSWEFAELRLAIEALTRTDRGYFAVTTDRLVYRSEDGLGWEAVAAPN